MINTHFLLIVAVVLGCGYVLVTSLFLLGLCRAAAIGNNMAEEAQVLINYQAGTSLINISEQIESATL